MIDQNGKTYKIQNSKEKTKLNQDLNSSEKKENLDKMKSVRNLLETQDFNSDFDSQKFYLNSSILTSERLKNKK